MNFNQGNSMKRPATPTSSALGKGPPPPPPAAVPNSTSPSAVTPAQIKNQLNSFLIQDILTKARTNQMAQQRQALRAPLIPVLSGFRVPSGDSDDSGILRHAGTLASTPNTSPKMSNLVDMMQRPGGSGHASTSAGNGTMVDQLAQAVFAQQRAVQAARGLNDSQDVEQVVENGLGMPAKPVEEQEAASGKGQMADTSLNSTVLRGFRIVYG